MNRFDSNEKENRTDNYTLEVGGTPKSLKDWALSYAERGWPVFPCHSIRDGQCSCGKADCGNAGKHPRTRHAYKDSAIESRIIEKWWSTWPDANIGIATGKVSGLAILDIDPDKGGWDSLKKLEEENGALPKTLTVSTGGGGQHYYFKNPETGFKSTGGALGPGIDTRGKGGYVIAPPSNHRSGSQYEWVEEPGKIDIAELPAWISEGLRSSNCIQPGGRHAHLTSFAGRLRQRVPGLTLSDLCAALLEENQKRCSPPLDEKEVRRIAGCIDRYPIRRGLTDAGNAERLMDRYGGILRYCPQWGKWLIWNGNRWVLDESGQIMSYAIQTARFIAEEVKEDDDKGLIKAIRKFSKDSQSKSKLEAMIKLAQHMASIDSEELDKDSWLFNCGNGTLDLRTGYLLPSNPDNFITKSCHVNYELDAECPFWLKFLDDVTGGNDSLKQYLQKLVGYSLTGETSEQCLIILYGMGLNGKTTFIETTKAVFGDYSKKAEMRSFLSRSNEGANNDIASLCGARFVSAVEVGRGKSFNESLVKELTGGDSITARFLFKEFFTYKPQFKIFLAVNTKPNIQGSDLGIWRRVKLICFDQKIDKDRIDKELPEKLKQELPGILNWALEGCLKWQKEGLKEPKTVIEATSEYRKEMDAIEQFIEDKCDTASESAKSKSEMFVLVDDLYGEYLTTAIRNGEDKIPKRNFGIMMAEAGYKSKPKSIGGTNRRVYQGICLKDTPY